MVNFSMSKVFIVKIDKMTEIGKIQTTLRQSLLCQNVIVNCVKSSNEFQ